MLLQARWLQHLKVKEENSIHDYFSYLIFYSHRSLRSSELQLIQCITTTSWWSFPLVQLRQVLPGLLSVICVNSTSQQMTTMPFAAARLTPKLDHLTNGEHHWVYTSIWATAKICHGQIIGFIFPYKGMFINLLRIIYIYIGICTPMEWDGWLFLPFISIKTPSNLTKASFIPSSWMISQSWRLTRTMRLARKRLVFWMRNQQHSPLHCSKESSIHWYLHCSWFWVSLWFATSLVLWISDAVCHH